MQSASLSIHAFVHVNGSWVFIFRTSMVSASYFSTSYKPQLSCKSQNTWNGKKMRIVDQFSSPVSWDLAGSWALVNKLFIPVETFAFEFFIDELTHGSYYSDEERYRLFQQIHRGITFPNRSDIWDASNHFNETVLGDKCGKVTI